MWISAFDGHSMMVVVVENSILGEIPCQTEIE